ncbi:response regulator [Gammaproteobacteria bacterium]|nr:response regulator [Gammaproteobacteria bacterium]
MLSQKVSILLAEDNKANQLVSKAMLNAIGADVELANDGLEVLSLLSSKPFELILMDCQMPNLDGLEATARIRQMEGEAYQSIPIIALTADVQESTREECLRLGMNDFLSKPFMLNDLLAIIKKNLKNSK